MIFVPPWPSAWPSAAGGAAAGGAASVTFFHTKVPDAGSKRPAVSLAGVVEFVPSGPEPL